MDPAAIRALVDEFNAAWGAHDLDAALALTTADCLFDATGPAPDGTPHRGHDGSGRRGRRSSPTPPRASPPKTRSSPTIASCRRGATTSWAGTSVAST